MLVSPNRKGTETMPAQTHRRPTPGRLTALGLIATCAASAAMFGLATPSSASPEGGALAVEPAQGKDDWGAIWFVSSAPCPAPSTHYKVRISGANFPDHSNAIGNQTLANLGPTADGKGLAIPLWGSWDTVARTNNAKVPLDGTARISLLCINHFGTEVYAEMTGEVRFAKVDGGPSTYEQVGGPTLKSGQPRTEADVVALAQAAATTTAPPPSGAAATPAGPSAADPVAGAAPQAPAADAQAPDPGTAGDPEPQTPAQGDAARAEDATDTVATATEASPDRGTTGIAVVAGFVAVASAAGAVFHLRKKPRARFSQSPM